MASERIEKLKRRPAVMPAEGITTAAAVVLPPMEVLDPPEKVTPAKVSKADTATRRCTLRAYKVSCRDDDHGEVITFAKSAKAADRYANSHICDCDFIHREVRRAPAFDKYAPGPVTAKDYLAEGWYRQCGECECQIYNDHEGIVVTDGDRVYCGVACLEKHLAWCRKLGPNAHESVLKSAAAAEAYLAGRCGGGRVGRA